MIKNITPFGYVPDKYLENVCFWGGIKWDDYNQDYVILAEEKSGKQYRNFQKLAGIKTIGSEKLYAITPQFHAMMNFRNRKISEGIENWYEKIDFGPEEESVMNYIRTSSFTSKTTTKIFSEAPFDED